MKAGKNIRSLAEDNLIVLSQNTYPGRGIVAGLDETGENLIQVYWIMGRSENSRNRVFSKDSDGRVFTEAADPAKVKDSSLIIYNAMREVIGAGVPCHVVSNGNQTDVVIDGYKEHENMYTSLRDVMYEPDEPNFTPRITAVSFWTQRGSFIRMSLLRKSPFSDECTRHLYEINGMGAGFGHCLTTYRGDGDPLPPFRGEPYLVPLNGDAQEIADTFWKILNEDNKVSLVVKSIPRNGPPEIIIINKYSKVG